MKQVFLFVFLIPIFASAQIVKDNSKETDPDKMEIKKNIFRVLVSASTDTKIAITGNYEREIAKPFTLFFKAGPAIDREFMFRDAYGEEQYKWVFNAIASAELRYYYNLKRRTRLKKTVRNFSAFYLSLEEQIVSKPVFIINKTGDEELKWKNREYINIGYQYQKKTTYFNVFFGTRFPGPVYSNTPSGIELLHAGLTIGKVF